MLTTPRREYHLTVRQEPKQARMCGVGGKADRRPIDPPPIVQLRVIDPTAGSRSDRARHASTPPPGRRRRDSEMSDGSSDEHGTPGRDRGRARDRDRPYDPHSTSPSRRLRSPAPRERDEEAPTDVAGYAQSFLQNPYYFMFASLAKPDDDKELHWLKSWLTFVRIDAGFFVFPDLSVRTEGSYRLKLSLFEVVGNNVRHCKSIYSAPFYVYTAKKFPGMEESTPLSCSLADQGIKIRIRKDIRVRKRPLQALEHPLPPYASTSAAGAGYGGERDRGRDREREVERETADNERDRGRDKDDNDDEEKDDDDDNMDGVRGKSGRARSVRAREKDRDRRRDREKDKDKERDRDRDNSPGPEVPSTSGRKAPKRSRTDDGLNTPSGSSAFSSAGISGIGVGVPLGPPNAQPIPVPQQHPWPPLASLDPTLGPAIPPPAQVQTPTQTQQVPLAHALGSTAPGPQVQAQQVIPPPPPPGQEIMNTSGMGVYDARQPHPQQGSYQPYDHPQQQQQQQQYAYQGQPPPQPQPQPQPQVQSQPLASGAQMPMSMGPPPPPHQVPHPHYAQYAPPNPNQGWQQPPQQQPVYDPYSGQYNMAPPPHHQHAPPLPPPPHHVQHQQHMHPHYSQPPPPHMQMGMNMQHPQHHPQHPQHPQHPHPQQHMHAPPPPPRFDYAPAPGMGMYGHPPPPPPPHMHYPYYDPQQQHQGAPAPYAPVTTTNTGPVGPTTTNTNAIVGTESNTPTPTPVNTHPIGAASAPASTAAAGSGTPPTTTAAAATYPDYSVGANTASGVPSAPGPYPRPVSPPRGGYAPAPAPAPVPYYAPHGHHLPPPQHPHQQPQHPQQQMYQGQPPPPQMPPPHMQHQQHYQQHMQPAPQQQQQPQQQRPYAPVSGPAPAYSSYGTGYGMPPPAADWGTPPAPAAFGVNGVPTAGAWDTYGQHNNNNNTAQGHPHGANPVVGAVGSPGDRIQLAPLRGEGMGGPPAVSPVLPAGYPNVQIRSSSRDTYGQAQGMSAGSGMREERREEWDRDAGDRGRDRERDYRRGRDGSVGRERERDRDHRDRDDDRERGQDRERGDRGREWGSRERGKKNPLSIGSIISDETG
ncbi:hypothetical protein H0H81_010915 [Sphagnurus paluster]|uniref:Velvet domain-containing protein n=1 Tax=Sphagnurus paluster TaxID=117069 RepID=A0A9P7FWT8_9AGAR|nr:hypothetical protein H0H81_010915 [Sphagnurus paluster]